MTIDSKLFRQTVGRFLTGVTVVATDIGGEVQAMTVNSFTSLSLDPPLVLFCPGKTTRTGKQAANFKSFSVNILREDQQELSNYFAGSWKQPEPPPFNFEKQNGVPCLEGCMASLACAVRQVYEGGDHWIVVGEVQELYQGAEPLRPLGFYLGKYVLLEQVKTAAAPAIDEDVDPKPVHYHRES